MKANPPAIRRQTASEFRLWPQRAASGELAGVLEYALTSERLAFAGSLDLVAHLRALLDAFGMIQPTHRLRNWRHTTQRGGGSALSTTTPQPQPPTGASFMLRIQYAHNATWQGTLEWLEKGETVAFRSALELLHLLDDAVGESGVTSDNPANNNLQTEATR